MSAFQNKTPWRLQPFLKKDMAPSQALVAHACNPSYSEGRDLEDCGLKPARPKSWLAEWLKMKALNSSPNTSQKKEHGSVVEQCDYHVPDPGFDFKHHSKKKAPLIKLTTFPHALYCHTVMT
jgi:hypothetical protein